MLRLAQFTAVVLSVTAATAAAQGLRVSTVVYDASRLDRSGKEPVLSRSITLFHNGRAYDYVEAAGEVVVFDKASKRFTVINAGHGVFTRVAFAELQALLKNRGPQTQEYIAELQATNAPGAAKAARTLSFQLAPEFEQKFHERSGILTLRSRSLKYSVSTNGWEDADQVESYLQYADWTARLNYLLHPSAMFPEPRLALNRELRSLKSRLPVVVQLDLRPDDRMVLRAEHQFVRSLTEHDRSLIGEWDESLQQLQEVPLRRYQQSVLVSGK